MHTTLLTVIYWAGEKYNVKVADEDGNLECMANYDSLSDARHAAFTTFNYGHVVDCTVK